MDVLLLNCVDVFCNIYSYVYLFTYLFIYLFIYSEGVVRVL